MTRNSGLRSILSLAAAAGVAAMLSTSPAAAQGVNILHATLGETTAKTGEVDTAQLRQILVAGTGLVLDTRSRDEFDAGHIPGAVNLDASPPKQIDAVLALVGGDKSKALVLYCNGPFCQASRRLGDLLVQAGFSNVRRYQLGIPVCRALGGPTAVEIGGVKRVIGKDATAVFIDARASELFAKGSLPGARSAPIEDLVSGRLKKVDLPEDDFNRRVILFGRDGTEARRLAEHLSKRPWHNVMYFSGSFAELAPLAR